MELLFVAALLFMIFVAPLWIAAHYATKESIALADRQAFEAPDRIEDHLNQEDHPRRNPYWRRRALLKARRRR